MKLPHHALSLALALAPTAMLFIPCRAGISHNPAEHAELSDIVRGTELLSAAVRKLVVD